jgi:hypothetical protein
MLGNQKLLRRYREGTVNLLSTKHRQLPLLATYLQYLLSKQPFGLSSRT